MGASNAADPRLATLSIEVPEEEATEDTGKDEGPGVEVNPASPEKPERKASTSTPWTPNARAAPFTPSSSRISPHASYAHGGEAPEHMAALLPPPEAGSRHLVPPGVGYDGYSQLQPDQAWQHEQQVMDAPHVGLLSPSMQYHSPLPLQQQVDEAAFIEGYNAAVAQMQAQEAQAVAQMQAPPPTFVKPVYTPVLPHAPPAPVPAMAPLPPQVAAPAPPVPLTMQAPSVGAPLSPAMVLQTSPTQVLHTPPEVPPSLLPPPAQPALAQPKAAAEPAASEDGKAWLLTPDARENGSHGQRSYEEKEEKAGGESPRTSLLKLCGAWGALEKSKMLDRRELLGFKLVSDDRPPAELGNLQCTTR